MAISPLRAFALGACSVILMAGVFVAGIGIGARDGVDSSMDAAGPAEEISCPDAPGFTATRAENERAANCESARRIQDMLRAAGAADANVSVQSEETGELLGPERVLTVIAQVDLPLDIRDGWNAEEAARAISREIGTTMSHVTITDERLRTLYDGRAQEPRTSIAPATSAPIGRPASTRTR
ncbi:MAG: hypothetical protein JWL76_2428 [Thermoleophilia bacterium]|nr:hypothetical protein [Thermoleophilia bacterium]